LSRRRPTATGSKTRAPSAHLISGARAEKSAQKWLQKKGLLHVLSNFRCRHGELDLVMRDAGCLVIVEVRYRRLPTFGGALESVSATKQRRIGLATQQLLREHRELYSLPLRFDVLAMSGPVGEPAFDWRRNAFCFDSIT